MADQSHLRASETAYAPLSQAVVGISPQFLTASHPTELTVVIRPVDITDTSLAVVDHGRNIVFKIKGALTSLHEQHTLVDAYDKPIASLRQKIFTAHKRWQVFRGESSDPMDLLFSVRKSSLLKSRSELDVFLATNTKEEDCDFKVRGSYLEKACTIYAGDCATVIAHIHKKHTVQSLFMGKEVFNLTVYPNIDYAFMVALTVVLDEINDEEEDSN